MLIWLRECENSSTKKDKIIKPYYHSLFWWRKSSFDMINNQKDILKKDLSKEDVSKKDLSTKDISNKDLSKEDLSNKDLSNKDPSKEDISKEDISKDIPKSISKDIPKSISKDIPKSISKNIPNGISKDISNGISKDISNEQWLYHFLFFTNPLFDSPHLSCSPSEFWSKRWHLLYRNCFVELGYLPCKKFMNNYYPSFLPHKKVLSHIFGTFAGFLWSCIFHEYVIHSLFGLANGEHFTFFLFHGIIAIFWEIIVTLSFRKNDNTAFDQKRYYYTKKVIGFVLWNSILILSAPWFAEPYIRAKHHYCYPHFGCDKGYKGY
ncbi:hypothetical protein RhiirA5_476355 [Rhizophagus irregularis]|uniref:Wax synthase domain-containing protein n=1 Tax=Rhizophagus irregularis TaxID=588596 RepID=A0A2N0PPJ4_9GLOM|nr:hypothetical protein RhiirA5_476355 [Rhizophagus irregularis]